MALSLLPYFPWDRYSRSAAISENCLGHVIHEKRLVNSEAENVVFLTIVQSGYAGVAPLPAENGFHNRGHGEETDFVPRLDLIILDGEAAQAQSIPTLLLKAERSCAYCGPFSSSTRKSTSRKIA